MDSMLMLKTSFALMTITALGGVVMTIIRFAKNTNPPAWLAMLHGLLAASGLTLLLFAYFSVGLPVLAAWGLLLFVIAAAGGAFMALAYDTRLLPKAIVVAHALLAVCGYALILVALCGES